MNNSKREHAIVLGGSIAGLFTARMLSDHFNRVTIIERDPVHDKPESRKGQPQTRHVHAVLTPARRFIQTYLPQVEQNLVNSDVVTGDFGEILRFYQYGQYRPSRKVGLEFMSVSRPFLEYHVRWGVLQIANISLRDNTSADELVVDDTGTKVIGVRVTDRSDDNHTEMLYADLVIDACGRGTPTPKWLAKLGYDVPENEQVTIHMGYTTRVYKRQIASDENPKMHFIAATPPHEMMGGYLFPIEDDRWICTLAGMHNDHAPTDESGFLEAARNLPTMDIYNIISQTEPLSEIRTHKYPASRRFRYNRLTRFPEGFLALGDSVASFNPIYGQGMSSAALQVEVLNDLLQQREQGSLWRSFFKNQAKVVDRAWLVAVDEDFRYPETEGKKRFGVNIINLYNDLVNHAAYTDEIVAKHMSHVIHLLKSPFSLTHPRIMWRVLRAAI